MSTINRRTFIKGTTASSLFVLTLAGCSEKKSAPIKSAQAQGVTQGSAKPHYVMVFDQNKCVGCGECKEACAETNKTPAGVFRLALERQNGREPGTACPYNVRFINPQTRVAENCDFCLHTKLAKGEDPACVSKCRYGALAFGDLNDPNSYVAKLLDVKDAVRVRTYLGTEPSLRYIPVMKEEI